MLAASQQSVYIEIRIDWEAGLCSKLIWMTIAILKAAPHFKGSLCVSKKEGGETFRKITGRKSKARIYTFLLLLFDSLTALFCYHQHKS